jgi:hypothetical protein
MRQSFEIRAYIWEGGRKEEMLIPWLLSEAFCLDNSNN